MDRALAISHDVLNDPRAPEVITKAVVRAANLLGMKQRQMANVLGVDASTYSRIANGATNPIRPRDKTGELALLFIRVFRSLDSLLGGDEENCRIWMHGNNRDLNGRPVDLVQSVQGIIDVAEYLDAMRGA